MRSTARITGAVGRSRKALLLVGSAAALLGAGSGVASAATVAPRAHAETAAAVVRQHPAQHAAPQAVGSRNAGSGPARPRTMTWGEAAEIQAHRTDPGLKDGQLPAADQLRPVALYGPQETMQITPAQYGNAATIVHQALAKRMGVRSAVIAVATAMQESELNNINYGTSDSLGLFQQQSDCGWGTPQQIMNPAYASDAFLGALQKYQAENPQWAHQPLWQSAQGVQASGFPTAYAKWEAQAAGLVQSITTQQTR
jgi:hypothetical protein